MRTPSPTTAIIAKMLNFIINPGKGGIPLIIKIKSAQLPFSSAEVGPLPARGPECSAAPKNLREKKIKVYTARSSFHFHPLSHLAIKRESKKNTEERIKTFLRHLAVTVAASTNGHPIATRAAPLLGQVLASKKRGITFCTVVKVASLAHGSSAPTTTNQAWKGNPPIFIIRAPAMTLRAVLVVPLFMQDKRTTTVTILARL